MNGASWEEFFIFADCHGGCCIQPALDEVREGFENMTHHPLYLISLCSSSLTFFPPLGPCCAWPSSRCNCNASHFYSDSVLATDGLLWFIIAWIQRSYFCSPPCGARYLRSYGFRLHPPFSKWMLMSCNVGHLVHSAMYYIDNLHVQYPMHMHPLPRFKGIEVAVWPEISKSPMTLYGPRQMLPAESRWVWVISLSRRHRSQSVTSRLGDQSPECYGTQVSKSLSLTVLLPFI